jgi:hypothetical protein
VVGAYWIATLAVASELWLGGIWDMLRVAYMRHVIEELGYPLYFLIIIGVWKVPAAVVLVAPNVPTRPQGMGVCGFDHFVYIGAAASHVATGRGKAQPIALSAILFLTALSWALRSPKDGACGRAEVA